jgi:hypothetical protein
MTSNQSSQKLSVLGFPLLICLMAKCPAQTPSIRMSETGMEHLPKAQYTDHLKSSTATLIGQIDPRITTADSGGGKTGPSGLLRHLWP